MKNKGNETIVEKAEDSIENFFSPSKKKKGKIEAIRATYILVNVDGNGVSIPYKENEHSKLKVGDPIDVP